MMDSVAQIFPIVAPVLDGALLLALSVMLLSGRVSPTRAFAVFALVAMITGRIPYGDAMHALGSPAIWAVISLVVFSLALGKIGLLRRMVFSRKIHGLRRTLARMLGSAALLSAFVPNTAVVAALLGPTTRRPGVSAHQLLLPLSYMALAAGMVTPFGTSASLMVVGRAQEMGVSLDVFDFLGPGLMATGAVLVVLLIVSPRILSRRAGSAEISPEIFHVEVRIEPGSRLAGKTVAQNQLRQLHSFYLAEIVRDDETIAPVRPTHYLREGDRLIFVGDVAHLDEIRSLPGATVIKDEEETRHDKLYRAVVASSSVMVGRTLREVDFRARFDASVLAVGRASQSLSGKLGDIRLRAGDLLLLAAGHDFHTRDNLRANLHILDSDDVGLAPLSRMDTLGLATAFLAFLATALSLPAHIPVAAFVLACVGVMFNWVSAREVKRAFPFDLVIVLWGAVLLSMLVQSSGLAGLMANSVAALALVLPPFAAVVAIFLLAWVLTEFFSNTSAALITLPVALETAGVLQSGGQAISAVPFALAAAFGASASYLMPFGYQTHLMVMGPGRYRVNDYVRLGGAVFVAYAIAALAGIGIFQF